MSHKIIAILFCLFSAVVLSFSLVTAKDDKETLVKGDLEQTIFQVSNLSCGSCLAHIQEELQKYQGLGEISADLSKGLVAVDHTADFDKEAIAQAITAAGYPARLLSEPELAALKTQGSGGSAGLRARRVSRRVRGAWSAAHA